MFRVISKNLTRTAALPENIRVPLDAQENRIFEFIRSAINEIPGRPVARVAGGWIRDKLLGRPSKDIDITVEGMKGVEFAELLKQFAVQQYGADQKIIGTIKDTEARPEQVKNLAVAFLRIYGQDVEILNLRGDEVYEPGSRNPVSTNFNASPEEDAVRRDLTINSMFYNIVTGRVEDFTGTGYDDLMTLTLRTPLEPVKTFQDDPLRVLRVLRFNSRYPQSTIAPEVIQAMADEGVQQQIVNRLIDPNSPQGIVAERTAEEMRKIMKGEQPETAIKIMYETGLLTKMLNLPASFHPLDMNQMNRHHDLTVMEHTLEVLQHVNNLSGEFGFDDNQRVMMNFSALFHDLGKLDPRSHKAKPDGTRGYSGNEGPDSLSHQQSSAIIWQNFSKALKLSDEERTTIGSLVSDHMNPHSHVEGMQGQVSDRTLRRYLRKNPLWVFQYVHAMADSMSKTRDPDEARADPYRANLERLRALTPSADTFGNAPRVQDALNGHDIINLVGLPPQPPTGLPGYIEVVKERIREQQDLNPNLTRDDAVAIVQTMVSSGELDAYRV